MVAVSTVQEEVGLRGRHDRRGRLDVAFVTDVGQYGLPGIDRNRHGDFKLGGGPKIAVGGPAQPLVVERLLAAAAAEEIGIQRTATPGRSAPTPTRSSFEGRDPRGLVSLPIRYMHTTVETTSLATSIRSHGSSSDSAATCRSALVHPRDRLTRTDSMLGFLKQSIVNFKHTGAICPSAVSPGA